MAEVVPIEDVDPPKRRSPAHILIDKMPDKYLTTRQVAEHFNVNVNTIRRLSKSRKLDGTKRVKVQYPHHHPARCARLFARQGAGVRRYHSQWRAHDLRLQRGRHQRA